MNNNLFGILGGLMSNPMNTLQKNGLNIPQNMNDPQQIIQHLLNSGQISQGLVNQAMQMKDNPMFKNLLR